MYQRVYYAIDDKLKGEIEHRYNSPTFVLYSDIELVLRKSAIGESIPPDDLSKVSTERRIDYRIGYA